MAKTQSTSKTNTSGATSMAELMAKQSGAFNVLQKGQEIEGTVKKLTPKEILLDIGAKGDALVIEYDKTNLDHLLSILKVGDKVKAVVISPESEEGFPVVSLRRTLGQITFGELDEAFKSDSVIKISVQEPTRGGYFAQTKNGVRGFLPNSQTTAENLSGTEIDAKIIEFDKAKKRVIFSQKAVSYLTNTTELRKLFPKGEKLTGKISQIAPYGLFIEAKKDGNTVEGFVHISEVSHDRVENLNALFNTGDELTAAILDVDAENRRLALSLKQLAADAFEKVKEKYSRDTEVKGTVTDVKARGITVELEKASGPEGLRPGGGVNGFIPAEKVPTGTEYKKGDSITATVSDIDSRKRVVVLSPVVTKTFVGYR